MLTLGVLLLCVEPWASSLLCESGIILPIF